LNPRVSESLLDDGENMKTKEDATHLLETMNEVSPFLSTERISLTIGQRELWALRAKPHSASSSYIYFCSKGWWYVMREDGSEKIDGLDWKEDQFWEVVASIVFLSGLQTAGAQSGLPKAARKTSLGIGLLLKSLESMSEDWDYDRRVRKLAKNYLSQLSDL
jgi:hypothetical protein